MFWMAKGVMQAICPWAWQSFPHTPVISTFPRCRAETGNCSAARAAQPNLCLTAFLPSENYPLTQQIKVLFSKLLCNFDPPGAFLVIAFISLAR
jgi:hypothetical protein